MRVRLIAGKQKELIYYFKSKKGYTWKELSDHLGVNKPALIEWKLENNLMPLKAYEKMDPEGLFSKEIVEIKEEGWGKRKGGRVSKGNIKNISKPAESEKLSEFIGIVLGDGNIKAEKNFGVYQVRIAGNSRKEGKYLNFIYRLSEELFGIKPRRFNKEPSTGYVCLDSKRVVDYLIEKGLKSGNKIVNGVKIPYWIKSNKKFLKCCVRGLIDTDGCVSKISNKDPNLARITFTNHNLELLKDTKKALETLGYHPSKLINNRVIYLSRQKEIKRYVKDIGFSNSKHIRRLKKIAP